MRSILGLTLRYILLQDSCNEIFLFYLCSNTLQWLVAGEESNVFCNFINYAPCPVSLSLQTIYIINLTNYNCEAREGILKSDISTLFKLTVHLCNLWRIPIGSPFELKVLASGTNCLNCKQIGRNSMQWLIATFKKCQDNGHRKVVITSKWHFVSFRLWTYLELECVSS